MTNAGRLMGMVLVAFALVQCDQVESVTFPYKVGVLDDNNAPEVFDVEVDCAPLDEVMPYPLFTRLGLTQISEQTDGFLFARSDNSRRYIFDGETWQPGYTLRGSLQGSLMFPPEAVEWIVYGTIATVPESLPDLTWDFWYPPNTEQYVRLTAERIWRGDLYSENINRDEDGAWQPPDNPPEVSPYDFLWNSTVEFSLFQVTETGFYHPTWRDSEAEIPADTRVANWWSALFGTSKYDWVSVGGEANGPGTATYNLAEAVAAADSVKGRITRYSYYLEEGRTGHWDETDFENPPGVPLADVFGSSAFDFWVVGNAMSKSCPRVTGEIYHCNDTRCALSARVPGAFLKSIHGTSGTDFYVVGGNDEQNAGTVILQYKNGEWNEIEVPTEVPLNRIWVAPWGAAYAVGGAYSPDGTPSSIALMLEGGEWTVLDLGAEMPLYDVYGPSKDDVYFVGEEGIFHYPDARNDDLADIAVADSCHLYCLRLREEEQDESPWLEECIPNCKAWLTDSISISPTCHHGISVLMQCINQSSYADAEAFLDDPSSEEGACVAEYADVHCDEFTLVTDLANPEK